MNAKMIRFNGHTYRPVVLIVRTRNEDGSPGLLEHLRDTDVARVDQGENEFVIVLMREDVARGAASPGRARNEREES